MIIQKMCYKCFAKLFPEQKIKVITWGRECAGCHQATEPLDLLIKVVTPTRDPVLDRPEKPQPKHAAKDDCDAPPTEPIPVPVTAPPEPTEVKKPHGKAIRKEK